MDGDIEWGGWLSRMKGVGKASTGGRHGGEDRGQGDEGPWKVVHVHSTQSNRGEAGKSGVQGCSGGGGGWGRGEASRLEGETINLVRFENCHIGTRRVQIR